MAETGNVARSIDDQMNGTACTLDHDGCVVCSDAGIPLRVLSLDGDDARCVDDAGNEAMVAVELVAPVRVGEILLTHGGVAIGRCPTDTLRDRATDGVAAVLNGGNQ